MVWCGGVAGSIITQVPNLSSIVVCLKGGLTNAYSLMLRLSKVKMRTGDNGVSAVNIGGF